MNIICYICNKLLTEQGGLLFSPPTKSDKDLVAKIHFCQTCYSRVWHEVYQLKENLK